MGRMFTFISAGLRISAVAFVIAFAMRFPFSSVRPKVFERGNLVGRAGGAGGRKPCRPRHRPRRASRRVRREAGESKGAAQALLAGQHLQAQKLGAVSYTHLFFLAKGRRWACPYWPAPRTCASSSRHRSLPSWLPSWAWPALPAKLRRALPTGTSRGVWALRTSSSCWRSSSLPRRSVLICLRA